MPPTQPHVLPPEHFQEGIARHGERTGNYQLLFVTLHTELVTGRGKSKTTSFSRIPDKADRSAEIEGPSRRRAARSHDGLVCETASPEAPIEPSEKGANLTKKEGHSSRRVIFAFMLYRNYY